MAEPRPTGLDGGNGGGGLTTRHTEPQGRGGGLRETMPGGLRETQNFASLQAGGNGWNGWDGWDGGNGGNGGGGWLETASIVADHG